MFFVKRIDDIRIAQGLKYFFELCLCYAEVNLLTYCAIKRYLFAKFNYSFYSTSKYTGL